MRIAIYSGTFQRDQDGATMTIYRLVDSLLAAGNEVGIWAYSITPQERPGLYLFSLPSTPLLLYRDYRVAVATPRLIRTLDEFAPDIIQVTVPDIVGKQFVRYAKRNRIPVVSTYHTVFPDYFKYYYIGFLTRLGWKLATRFYRCMDAVYAPTEISTRELRRRGLQNIKIWSRGVDLKRYRPTHRRKQFRDSLAGGRPIVILYSGRLVAYKDVHVLADVYQKFHTGPERPVRFVVAGSGPKMKSLKRRMPEAVFTGYLLGDDLARVYANSDLLLFPSPTESFGNVVLEALASGIPAVVSDRGGCQEIIAQSGGGLVARTGIVSDFYGQCRRLIDDPNLRLKMGQRGLEFARGRTWDVITDWLVKELTAQAKPHRDPVPAHPARRPAESDRRGKVSNRTVPVPVTPSYRVRGRTAKPIKLTDR